MKIKLFLEGLKEGQKLFGEVLFGVINFVLLSLVYFLGIGITSIIAKISKTKFLDNKYELSETYWEDLKLNKKSLERYYNQF